MTMTQDDRGNVIERRDGKHWVTYKYDEHNNLTETKKSDGYCEENFINYFKDTSRIQWLYSQRNGKLINEFKFDENSNMTYHKDQTGYWFKKKYEVLWISEYEDSDGNWWTLERFPNTQCPYV